MAQDLSAPGFQLTWEPTTAEFVGNGTVGYMMGCFEIHFTGNDGKLHMARGRYITTWRKQRDGSGKVVADIGSSDPE